MLNVPRLCLKGNVFADLVFMEMVSFADKTLVIILIEIYFYSNNSNKITKADCECGDNAECLPNYETGRQECKCRQGFRGDGLM